MTLALTDQVLQFSILFLSAIEFILAIYILVLNAWHSANRHAGGLLMLGAISTLAYGLLAGAETVEEARWGAYLLAAAVPAIQPMQLIVTVVLLKPDWLRTTTATQRRRLRWYWVLMYLLVLLPTALTVSDIVLGAKFWYTGLGGTGYTGGVVDLTVFAAGSLSTLIRVALVNMVPFATIGVVLAIIILERDSTEPASRLAWLLLAQSAFALIVMLGLRNLGFFHSPVAEVLTIVAFVLTYTYVTFRQMETEGRAPRGNLRPRLTALIMVVTIPLIVIATSLVSVRAANEIKDNTAEQLEGFNRALAGNVSIWLDLNAQALHQLVSLPDIISMDPEAQQPILEAMAETHPHMSLVSTIGRYGVNVARSDGGEPVDYLDRAWFTGIWLGQALSFHTEPDRSTGQPSLVTAMPIRDNANILLGIAMFVSELDVLAKEVAVSRVGDTGFAYVIDAQDQLVAHPDLQSQQDTFELTEEEEEAELRNMSKAPPVAMLRAGESGLINFVEGGQQWQAYVSELENGWGVIVQQPKSELVAIQWTLHRMSLTLVGVGTVVLLMLTWLTIFQAFRPINSLTRTASAISAGDMTAIAPVESEDEIGVLARSFNSMTTQLRDLIGGLEKRVADRTSALEASAEDLARRGAELEKANLRQAEINQQLEATIVQSQRRAALLQASTQVSRAIGQVRELDQMLPEVTQLISQYFGFYHVGIFLLDETQQRAVLRAANSAGGQQMLERGHQLAVASEGIVGHVTSTGQPRIAVDVGKDAVHFDTPELPETRSEMAVPLRIGSEILGALDVQSIEASAFGGEDLAALTTLAEQIAIAIQNARLFQAAQFARTQAEEAQRRYLQQAWDTYQRQEAIVQYEYTSGADPIGDKSLPEIDLALETGEAVTLGENAALATPIKFRDQIIGVIGLHETRKDRQWSPDEIALVQDVAAQIGLALENARLFEQTERRAQREALIGQIVSRVRQRSDIDGIMQTAVRELGKALGSPHTFVHLSSSLRPQPVQEVNDDRN